MKQHCLKDAIVDMVFAIADLPSKSDPMRLLKEKKLKKSLRIRLKRLEKSSMSGDICFDKIKIGDRDRLIQIVQFLDGSEDRVVGMELFYLISQHLGTPQLYLKRTISLVCDLKSLLAFLNEKEGLICSRNNEKSLSFVERRLRSIYKGILAKRYHLVDFMLEDGWILQAIRASDLCACNEENIKNIDFLLSAISGGDERKRYFA